MECCHETSPLLPKTGTTKTGWKTQGPRKLLRKPVLLACTVIFSFIALYSLRFPLHSVPQYIDHDFGVGFHLTAPYGTASISFPNGSTIDVAKVDASASYRETLHRLSLDKSRHLHPPYNSLEDSFRDLPRQCARHARKKAGLPASSDVEDLASMIQLLRSAVEDCLGGRKISGAVVTVPHLAALYFEDIEDAMEYVGLISVASWPYWSGSIGGFFPEAAAAYAGNGFGLCSNYTDLESCKQEQENPPPPQPASENVLSVSFTRGLLSSTWAMQSFSFSTSIREYFFVADFNLSWKERHNNTNDGYYWAAVRDASIKPALLANEYLSRTTHRVLLHGEMASNHHFQDDLRQTLTLLLPNNPPIIDAHDTFAAARGAAEMAKRTYWEYNHSKTTIE